MSSGKPQTRGLAALLRIEKERREREETGADEPIALEPESEQGRSAPHAVPYPAPTPESDIEVPPAAAEKPSEMPHEMPVRVEEATTTPVPAQQPETASEAPVPSESREERQRGAGRVTAPVTSLPRSRPRPGRPTSVPRQKVSSQSEVDLASDPGWEKFVSNWKPFLREGVKFKLCEFFYQNTAAVGRREFTTSTAQLSRISGSHRRHIFLVLRQLEDLGFIQKEGVETNRKDQGLVIRFFPDRQA